MRSFIKILTLTLTLTLVVLLAVSCGEKDNGGYKVMVSLGEGAAIEGDNPVTVARGESATFKVNIAPGYAFLRADGAVYDQATGILTVSDVSANTNVNFYTEPYPYDPEQTFTYLFRSDYAGDSTDVKQGSSIPAARLITVSANDLSRKFVGWSFNAASINTENMVSTDRTFSFRVSPEVATEDGIIEIFANYSDTNKIVYNLNGGSFDESTVNMRGNAYATVESGESTVTVRFSDEYLDFMECGSTFYDDGSFRKDGAVLTEYNTKPDGTGEAYSLGSKVPLLHDGEETVLYCIWSDATPDTAFDTAPVSMLNPASSNEYAPDWQTEGVMITAYYGNDKTVVIPEKIGGEYVIGIAAGAFSGCDMTTLVMGRHVQKIENGAFVGCTSLNTVYYPDGIYHITSDAFDAETTAAIKHLYVNATIAPRYAGPDTGGLAVKLSRLIAPSELPRIIVIAGSSSYQGLGTEYLEALLDGEYRVVNFGTTRTTHGMMYLEAMGHYATADDVVIYAPENSSYMFGERELYYKTLRDLEGMVNIYRYVDVSGYTNVFGAFAELNEYRYDMKPISYESVCEGARESLVGEGKPAINKYGDYQKSDRVGVSAKYYDSYYITLNEYVKSKHEGQWSDVGNQQSNSNYLDPNNNTWCKINDPYYLDTMNRAIDFARAGGARVYFSFCPVEGDKLVEGAAAAEWLDAYDALVDGIYAFDGRIGSCRDYIFASEYFYDNAFHLNDYGRTYRTYQLYLDLCTVLGITDIAGQSSVGTSFEGCLFDGGTVDSPLYPWTPEN